MVLSITSACHLSEVIHWTYTAMFIFLWMSYHLKYSLAHERRNAVSLLHSIPTPDGSAQPARTSGDSHACLWRTALLQPRCSPASLISPSQPSSRVSYIHILPIRKRRYMEEIWTVTEWKVTKLTGCSEKPAKLSVTLLLPFRETCESKQPECLGGRAVDVA